MQANGSIAVKTDLLKGISFLKFLLNNDDNYNHYYYFQHRINQCHVRNSKSSSSLYLMPIIHLSHEPPLMLMINPPLNYECMQLL
jgi:hypothetical protein